MTRILAANSGKTGRPRGKPWPKGKSGNPAGRPKDGESWAHIIAEVSNMTTDDILPIVGSNTTLGKTLQGLPREVQLKFLVVVRVMLSLLTDPNTGLLSTVLDRAEGKVTERIQVDDIQVGGLEETLDKVYGRKERGGSG
jgi:hypothetical protein